MSYTTVSGWAISSQLIVEAAKKRGIKTKILDRAKNVYSIFHPKTGEQILFKASASIKNNIVGSRIADYKDLTFQVIKKFVPRCPLPRSITISSDQDPEALLAKKKLNYPLVVKPLDGAHGEGVIVGISDLKSLKTALKQAFAYQNNDKAIVQELLVGDDYRVLVVGYKVISVSKRIPAFVVGDGTHTITQLVAKENKHPLRGIDHEKPLSKIVINDETLRVLKQHKLKSDSVPAQGQVVYLKRTANLSTGGVAVDFTDEIHPSTKELAEKIAESLRLGVVAIDFISSDITKELRKTKGGLIEINDTPGLRMHHYPYQGVARDVAGAIVELAVR